MVLHGQELSTDPKKRAFIGFFVAIFGGGAFWGVGSRTAIKTAASKQLVAKIITIKLKIMEV